MRLVSGEGLVLQRAMSCTTQQGGIMQCRGMVRMYIDVYARTNRTCENVLES